MSQKFRNIIFNLLIMGGGVVAFYFIIAQGGSLESHQTLPQTAVESSSANVFWETISSNFFGSVAILLAQIITIIVISRVFGFLLKKAGQPSVIGEILAGIVLGPSLIGAFFPEFFNVLFPPVSLNNLQTISNVGLILFMFVVGMELDFRVLRSKIRDAVVISQTGIIVPFLLGMALAYFLYSNYSTAETPFISFALFMGISMSITAFPVLARIAQERGINKTKLGTVILTSAAVNDITAWCVLALVIAIVKAGTAGSALYIILFAIIYVAVMILAVRPFLRKLSEKHAVRESVSKQIVSIYFLVLIVSAFCTELIGIHALFGAFMAGAIMPENTKFRNIFVEKTEDVATVLFLPLFFVYTGLRTKIGLLNDVSLWETTFFIVLVAIVGKFAGSAAAAKYVGRMSARDSLTVGALMNTRGLMELVAINIGYDLGVISAEIFTMLIIMALFTTFMTSPMLSLINRIFPDLSRKAEQMRKEAEGVFKVLVATGNPQRGKSLLRVAKTLLDGSRNTLEITAIHVTASADTNPLYSEQLSEESFIEIEEEAKTLNIALGKEYKVSDNVEMNIVGELNNKSFDFLLVGAAVSHRKVSALNHFNLFKNLRSLNKFIKRLAPKTVRFQPETLIRDKTKYLVEHSDCSVGIFVNQDFTQITSTLILLNSESDIFLLRYARRLLRNSDGEVSITVYDTNRLTKTNTEIAATIEEINAEFPDLLKVVYKNAVKMIYKKFSFMLVSYQTWNVFNETDSAELQQIPSTVIINKKSSRFSRRK